MRGLVALSLALSLSVACGRRASSGRLLPAGSQRAPVLDKRELAGPSAPDQAVLAPPESAWVPALRSGRYAEAALALDKAGDLSARPELRFARARAARELGDHGRAVDLLSGLEVALPVLSGRIEKERAKATFGAGSFAAAADLFEKAGDAESLTKAALSCEKAGDFPRAVALATRVVSSVDKKRRHSVECEARDVRARAAEKGGNRAQAIADLRWLTLEDPIGTIDAAARLSALAPTRAPTKEERLGRALTLGRSGERARAEAELEALATASGPALAPARVDRARAFAWYHSREDYRRASELFRRAGQGAGVDPAEVSFYAARSLARAQDDAAAIRGYREILQRFPRSTQAEQAAYLVARTHYAGGAFEDAVTAYDAYLGRFGSRARSRGEALYERSVAYLALGRHALAASSFEVLAKGERDARRGARLRQLEAVARAGAGSSERAGEAFRAIVREHPLTFAALASSARLGAVGASVPEPIPAGPLDAGLPPLDFVLPPAVLTLRGLGLDRDAEDELRRSERALTRSYGTRAGEAACSAYGLLDAAARRYQIAQDEVERHVLMVAPTPRTRWQWDCVYPRPYPDAVREAADATAVPAALLYAVMRQESGFRPDVSSGAGARGLMQLLPSTAERIATERGRPAEAALLMEPGASLWLSAQYLKKLLDAFSGNVPLALAAYNAGPVAVRRWLDNARTLPLDVFVARIPYGETLEYVERVMGNYARYRYLEQGGAGLPALALTLPPVPAPEAAPY